MILKAEKTLLEASGPAVGSADGKGPINGSLLRLAGAAFDFGRVVLLGFASGNSVSVASLPAARRRSK
jgi:hypothetical protein